MPAGRTFMDLTKFGAFEASDQMLGLPQPPLEVPYAGPGPVVDLPEPSAIRTAPLDLRDAIEQRESVRQYRSEPITLGELAFLLWCAQGVRSRERDLFTFRTVPSAGARHALEVYLLVNRVEGLAPGLYRYLALSHRLAVENAGEGIAADLTSACLNQQFVRSGAVTFFWTADAYRMTWRYGERGFRYLHIDAGHACQNLYLAAGTIGCGACAIGAFHDDEVNRLLGLDGEKRFILYVTAVGKKR